MNELQQSTTAQKYIGKRVTFDFDKKRMVGLCEKAIWNGYTKRGNIPDFIITIRGNSGKAIEVSLVESYAIFS